MCPQVSTEGESISVEPLKPCNGFKQKRAQPLPFRFEFFKFSKVVLLSGDDSRDAVVD
jgi:hypothetical protein